MAVDHMAYIVVCLWWSALKHGVPAVYILDFAILDGAEGVVQLGGDGAGLAVFGDYVLMSGVKVVYAVYGRAYGGCAASGSLLHFGQFLDGNVACFDFHVHIAYQLL